MQIYHAYILASEKNGTLIGVTSDIDGRMFKHRSKMYDGFTKKYNVTKLVYIEEAPDIESAIAREKQLKNWHRDWKKNLIERENPHWEDLYPAEIEA